MEEGKEESRERVRCYRDSRITLTKQNGRVAEQGNHAVLRAANGVYSKLLKTYKDSVIDA